MLYEITFTRPIETADGRPETDDYSQVIDAPAYRIDGTTGNPRFSDRMLGWIFDAGNGMNAETVTISQYRPVTIDRSGNLQPAASVELDTFNLANMRAALASLAAEVAAKAARP
jgi:hypothetical protein